MGIAKTCARRARVLLVLFACACEAMGAQPVEPSGEITLAEAIDAALRNNPELLASRYELTAAQARIVRAGSRPNPEVGLELENFAGSGAVAGIDALETTLTLSQVIELGEKRTLRRAVAEADSDWVAIDQRSRQLDVLTEVTRRFIDVTVAQERLQLAQETTRVAQQTLDAITQRVDAARSPQAEASRARIALTRASIDQRQSASVLRAARYALAATWGGGEPQFTQVNSDLYDFVALQPFPSLIERIQRNPDLLRFASEARLRDAELRLAQAHARPNLSLGIGVRRLEATDDAALVAGFSMPLPVFDRNQGSIREAQVRRAQSEAARNAVLVKTRAALYGLYQEVSAARERVESLRAEGIPQAQTALDQTRSGYERGRFSFLELLTAQQDVLALRAAVIDAASDYHQLLAELERITSEPLTNNDLEASLP